MTTRRTVLRMMGATPVAATGAAAWSTSSASASTIPDSATEQVPKGLRPGGELDQIITEQAAQDAFSGSLLITHRGRTVLARSCGWADKARSVRNGPDTLFTLASVAKIFAAVAIGQLAQRGKLRYDDTLGTHLTGFAPEIADQVTIHHLLTHTSGLGDYLNLEEFWAAAPAWTTAAQVSEGIGGFVRRETPAFPPGAGSRYSNSAFHLLDEIVAQASGQTKEDYLRKNVFQAAGMSRSDSYTLPQWRTDRRIAHPYWRPPGSADRVESLDEHEQLFVPGAFSTCAEMERFAHALWDEKLLDPGYTRLTLSGKLPMRSPNTGGPGAPPGPPPVTFEGYGPTVMLTNGHWWYGHNGGASNGASTELSIYPDSGFVTVILSNYEAESIRAVGHAARQLITGAGA